MNILNDGRPTFFSVAYQSYTNIDLTLVSPSIHHTFVWDVINDRDDHLPICIKFLNSHQEGVQRRSLYNLKNANWNNIRNDINLDLNVNDSNVNDINTHIIEKINTSANLHLRKSSNTIPRKIVPWFTACVATKIRYRKNALRKFTKYPTDENLQNYIHTRNEARKIILESKKQSWQNFISTIDCNTTSADMWRKIRAMEGKNKKPRITQLIENNTSFQNDEEIGKILGNHFQQTSSNNHFTESSLQFKNNLIRKNEALRNKIHSTYQDYNCDITIQEINAALKLCNGSSPGPDNIAYSFFKNMSDHQLEYIRSFFNKIWNEGQLPDDWKTSQVIPILKPQKEKNLVTSYRPIALTNCICKLYEKIISKRLSWIIESKNLISSHQYGFRKNLSTQDAVLELVNEAQNAILEKEHLVAVFLDIEKAYDCTWKERIINQLLNWKITGNLLKSIENFLSNRKFQVIVGSTKSSMFYPENGIPQGSVLSVILFLIAINNIFNSIKHPVKVILFADDVTIYMKGKDPEQIKTTLQSALTKIEKWGERNGFIISKSKSRAINFTNKHQPANPKLMLYNSEIDYGNTVKYLGIILDRKLKWRPYIEYIYIKCKKRENILRCLANTNWGANFTTLSTVYTATIRSIIDYGDIFYRTACITWLKKLNVVQNNSLRAISGALKTSPIISLEALVGIQNLEERRKIHLIVTEARILQNRRHPLQKIISSPNITHPKHISNAIREAKESLNFLSGYKIYVNETHKLAPFLNSKVIIDLSLTSFAKNNTPRLIFITEFQKIISSLHQNSLVVYTDGSKINEQTSSAYFCTENQQGHRLHNYASIFTAELHGIFMAIKRNIRSNRNILICTDSLSSIHHLNKSTFTLNHPIAINIHKVINQYRKQVTIMWIPSHIGIEGNTKADEIAKASTGFLRINDFKISLRDLKTTCKTRSQIQARNTWEEVDPATNHLRKLKTSIKPWSVSTKLPRRDAVIFHRLVIGHTRLNKKFIFTKDPMDMICPKCDQPVTIQHILMDCHGLQNIRNATLRNKSIFTLLQDNIEEAKNVIKFLKEAQLYHLI